MGGVADAGRIGRYRAEKALGAGSFATVWLAYDELLETRVAIKVLADNWARNAGVRQRFIDEARILRRIDHEHIVRVHEINELEDGRPYIVMSWADRGTLYDRIAARTSADPYPVAEAIALGVEICEALAVVHDFGVVHRDIKPSNILFRSVRTHERIAAQRAGRDRGDEAVMIADFGLAKDLAAASGFTLAAGTPAYMAPEQAEASSVIDRRVDVFAVTAVVYELLCGRPAFNSDTLSGVRRGRVNQGAAPPSTLRAGLDARFDRLIAQGLAHRPDDRFPSVIALAAALTELAGPPAAPAAAPPPPPAAPATVVGSVGPTGAPVEPVGAAGRVLDLVSAVRGRVVAPEGIDALATAEERLRRDVHVVLVGDTGARATGGSVLGDVLAQRPGVTVARVASPDDPAVAEADVAVLLLGADAPAPAEVTSHLGAVLRRAVAGPVAVEVLVVPAGDGDAAAVAADLAGRPSIGVGAGVPAVLDDDAMFRIGATAAELAALRAPLLRASAGLAWLEVAAAGAGSPADRAAILEEVDLLRGELPAMSELTLLRELAGGRANLPPPLRDQVRRLLLFAVPSNRLGLPDDADPGALRAAVTALGTEWRVLENTGRVPFTARKAMLVAQQSLDRMHAELVPDAG